MSKTYVNSFVKEKANRKENSCNRDGNNIAKMRGREKVEMDHRMQKSEQQDIRNKTR